MLSAIYPQDVKELKLTESEGGECTETKARFMCPVTQLAMNGNFRYIHHRIERFRLYWRIVCCLHQQAMHVVNRFLYLRNCGCVFSERALREVATTTCHKASHSRSFFLINITEKRRSCILLQCDDHTSCSVGNPSRRMTSFSSIQPRLNLCDFVNGCWRAVPRPRQTRFAYRDRCQSFSVPFYFKHATWISLAIAPVY